MNLSATMFLDKTGFAGPLAALQAQVAAAIVQMQGLGAAEGAAGAAGAAAAPSIAAAASATAAQGTAAVAAAAASTGLAVANAASASAAATTAAALSTQSAASISVAAATATHATAQTASAAAATAATGALVRLTAGATATAAVMATGATRATMWSTALAVVATRAREATAALLALRTTSIVPYMPSAPLALAAGARAATSRALALPFTLNMGGRGGASPPPLPPSQPPVPVVPAAAAMSFTRMLGPIVAVTAALGAFTLGVATMHAAVGEASRMEDFETSFVTLLGSVDAAEKRMQDLATFAETTPFELPEIAQASKLLQAFTGDALATGAGLRLVGDNAAALNPDKLQETALWMGRLFSALEAGQPLGEPLQNLTQLGLVTPGVRAQLLALQGQALATGRIMEELDKAFGRNAGAMERLSQTYSGRMSTLRDTWAATLRAFGEPVRDALKPMITQATEMLERLRPAAAAAGEAVASALRVGRQAITDGRLGELLGAALKAGFGEGINFLNRSLMAQMQATVAMLATPQFWTGAVNGAIAAFELLGTALIGIFSRPLAALEAGIVTLGGKMAQAWQAGTPLGIATQMMGVRIEGDSYETNFKQAQERIAKTVNAGLDDGAARAGDAAKDMSKAVEVYFTTLTETLSREKGGPIDVDKLWGSVRKITDELDAKGRAAEAANAPPGVPAGKPASGTPRTPIEGKGDTLQEGDRLARIGGFVGQDLGGAALREPMQRTAENTARTADGVAALVAGALRGFGPAFDRVAGEADTAAKSILPPTPLAPEVPATPLAPEVPAGSIFINGHPYQPPGDDSAGAPAVALSETLGALDGAAAALRAGAISIAAGAPAGGLARAAAFVGPDGGPALDYARRTAENTSRFIDLLKDLTTKIDRLQATPAWN